MNAFLPYGRQSIDEDDIAAVVSVLKGDWLTCGPNVDVFEASLCRACNASFAVVCSSATAALHMAALSVDFTNGGAVVVPAITFLATASAPHLAGAEVVFADVDAETGLLTPENLLETINTHVGAPIKAVIPVHLAGRVCDMPAIKAIADRYGIMVIEDACHALGAAYLDAKGCRHVVGSCVHSDMAVFSFHPVKTIAAGEGGAVTTNRPELAEKLELVRSHGMVRDPKLWKHQDLGRDSDGRPNPWYYEMQAPALNYRLSDINAALAASQLKKLKKFVERRGQLAAGYAQRLSSFAPAVLPPVSDPNIEPGWHLYAVRIDFSQLELSRGALMAKLKGMGVGTQVHYIPLPWQPYWRERRGVYQNFPGAAAYYERTLSLPLFPSMTDEDVSFVMEAFSESARCL